MPKSRTDLTEAEWAIIKAVWEMEPCTAPDIRELIDIIRKIRDHGITLIDTAPVYGFGRSEGRARARPDRHG